MVFCDLHEIFCSIDGYPIVTYLYKDGVVSVNGVKQGRTGTTCICGDVCKKTTVIVDREN